MIFAADRRLRAFLEDGALPYFGLLLFLVLGIWLFWWLRKRYRDHEDHAANEVGMLMHFREMKAQGDLTDEEFRSIKSRLIKSNDGPVQGQSAGTKDNQSDPKD